MATELAVSKPPPMEYPFASAPDILRSHQKDAYMTGELSAQLSSIQRALLGARFAHKYSNASKSLTELLYLCITTLLGNRTLGEEYCDVIQIESDTLRLVSLGRRIGYISSVVFAPWILSKSLPALRRKIRLKLELNVARARQHTKAAQTRSHKIQEYILQHLDSITSLNSLYALSLATFYFTGAYYHLSKRLFGLRYVFTKQLAPHERREGYEVLGVLLVLQMAVQSIIHVRETLFNHDSNTDNSNLPTEPTMQSTTALINGGVEVALTPRSNGNNGEGTFGTFNSADNLLADIDIPSHLPRGFAANTSTPVLDEPRYDLQDDEVMAWIPEGQQRKCTLCLEPFRDPSVTTCGHVFCWTCVQDWVKEKAECPLCRQSVLPQKVLPLR